MSREALIANVNLESHPVFNRPDFALDQSSAIRALATLQRAFSEEPIRSSPIHRILDFGCGWGAPTLALSCVAQAIGAELDAVQENIDARDEVVRKGIVTAAHFKLGDGIEYLHQVGKENGPKYDLVTGFWFGPDRIGELFRMLAVVCIKGMNSTGNIMLTSDNETLEDGIVGRCKYANATYFNIPKAQDNSTLRILVIPQAECYKFQDQW